MNSMDIVHFVENLERGGLERTVIDLIVAQREAGGMTVLLELLAESQEAFQIVGDAVIPRLLDP